MNWIQKLFCPQLDVLQKQVQSLAQQRLDDGILIDKLENTVKTLTTVNPKEWEIENKYPTGTITYIGRYLKGFGMMSQDVRGFFINPETAELKDMAFTGTDDEKALAIQKWVIKNITYVSDKSEFGLEEFWEYPQETLLLRRGDCDDGAILIANLLLASGIPYWKIRISAAEVYNIEGKPQGGHCFVTYYCEEKDKWVALDWCVAQTKYTFVNTINGRKRFKNLKVGDELPAFDEKNNKISTTKIIKIGNRNVKELYKIELERMKPIKCTAEHPWFVEGRWKRTDELKENDEIYFVSPKSFTNLFGRKEQYRRTSERQVKNNIFTRDDVRKKLSINNCMKRPEIVQKVYEKRLKFQGKSNPEKMFIKLCEEDNLPVHYVGDGSCWIAGKNPDFKVHGEKKVIEVTCYGYNNRDEKWAMERIKHFEKYGYKCLIVFFTSHYKLINPKEEIISFILNGKKIKKISKIKPNYQNIVWNLHCEPFNNYFVNGLLCHNCYYQDETIVKDKPDYKDSILYGKGKVWFSFNQKRAFYKSATGTASKLKKLNIKMGVN